MTSYSFESVINQTITFSAANDTLTIADTARNLLIEVFGTSLRLTTSAGSVTLAGTALANLSTSNLLFADGSLIAVGDLSGAGTNDSVGNTIDFSVNALITGAVAKNNVVYGLEGGDVITYGVGTGNNLIFGGAGGDTIAAGSGDNIIFGGSQLADSADGADRITLGGKNNIVYANGGDDSVSFSTQVTAGHGVVFYGGAGNDTLNSAGASGSIFADGGDGNDRLLITSSGGGDTAYGGLGNDTIDFSFSNSTQIIFGGRDVADTADGGDLITTGAGNTTLYANAGADTVVAGALAGRTALLYLGAGDDRLTSAAAAGAYQIFGGLGGDNINLTGHTGTAVVYGGSGTNDTTDSGDTIVGGAESDLLIYGNAGNDSITLTPAAGSTTLVYAGLGNDTIAATPGGVNSAVNLYGNAGNDRFALNFTAAGTTINILDFGAGGDSDILAVTLPGGVSAADLTLVRGAADTLLQRGTLTIGLTNSLPDFTATNLLISGSVLLTNFLGAAATLTGGAGSDQLIAGSNGDALTAGAGSDLLTGGAGNDKFSFASADFNSLDRVNGGAGTDRLEFTAAGTAITDDKFAQVSGVETIKFGNVDFSSVASQITLGAFATAAGIREVDATSITGSGGTRIDAPGLTAGLTFAGAAGVDNVVGTSFIDVMAGLAGNDVLTGGLGADALDGGAGNDTYAYSALAANISQEGADAILSFSAGTSTTTVDSFRFSAGAGNYNLGNLDTVVSGATISSIVAAGGTSTELVILNTASIATASVTAALDLINANVTSGQGLLDLFFDSTKGHAVLYYDQNGGASGGHILLGNLTGVTSLADMANFDFGDFSFV